MKLLFRDESKRGMLVPIEKKENDNYKKLIVSILGKSFELNDFVD